MKEISNRKSDLCFPMTNGIKAYVFIRKTHDVIHRHVSTKLAKWGLSVPKYGLILQLYDHDHLPLSALSNLIFRGNSNMTSLINRLQRDGFVQRVNISNDQRVKEFTLSKKGRDLAPKIISEYRGFLHQMMINCLTPTEQEMLINLLDKLKVSIIKKINEEEGNKNFVSVIFIYVVLSKY